MKYRPCVKGLQFNDLLCDKYTKSIVFKNMALICEAGSVSSNISNMSSTDGIKTSST